MKVPIFETHDRLLHFKKDQEANLFQGVEDCLKRNPDCVSMQKYFPYVYIFAHPRTADDGVTKRMIWQPRLTKPTVQTNSYLFRATSNTDIVEIIWMLPPEELWKQFEKGKVAASEEIMVSIVNYRNAKELLQKPHKDDFSEEKIQNILRNIQKPKFEMI